jgi:uncharacterized RmlC-like cupin family protein
MNGFLNRVLAAGALAALTVAPPVLAAQHLAPTRLNPDEIAALQKGGAGAGTSGVKGIQTIVLAGDPNAAGPYTIEIIVPANTRIAAHHHRDDRAAVVVSGDWFFGYGSVANAGATKRLTRGSFYTEPGGAPHFALTHAKPAAVIITGAGPTDTVYEVVKDDPRGRP